VRLGLDVPVVRDHRRVGVAEGPAPDLRTTAAAYQGQPLAAVGVGEQVQCARRYRCGPRAVTMVATEVAASARETDFTLL
jgi:hypothetical protein